MMRNGNFIFSQQRNRICVCVRVFVIFASDVGLGISHKVDFKLKFASKMYSFVRQTAILAECIPSPKIASLKHKTLDAIQIFGSVILATTKLPLVHTKHTNQFRMHMRCLFQTENILLRLCDSSCSPRTNDLVYGFALRHVYTVDTIEHIIIHNNV